MAQNKTLHVPIVPGMRQDLSDLSAPVGTIVDAANVRFSVDGEVEARAGTTALTSASDAGITHVNVSAELGAIGRCNDGFLLGAAGFGWRYDYGKDRMHVGGSYANAEPLGVFDVIAREENTPGSAEVPWPLSQAAVNGYVATVYSCGNGQGSVGPGDSRCVVHVFTEDGTLVTTFSPVATVSAAWIVADGSTSTTMVLITQDGTTGLNARVLTTSATGVTVGSAVSVGTLSANAAYWAACNWPGVGWVLLYQTAAGTLTVRRLSDTTSQDTVTLAVTGTVPLSVFCTTTHCFVGWRDGASEPYSVNARVYDANLDLTSGVGAITLETEATANSIGPPLFGSHVSLATRAMYAISRFEPVGAQEDTTWIYTGELRSDGTDTSYATVYGACCASAPFGYGYLWARAGGMGDSGATDSFYQGRSLLLDFMGWRESAAPSNLVNAYPVVALSGILFAGVTLATIRGDAYAHHLSTPCQLSDGSYVQGIPRIVRADSHAGVAIEFALAEWLWFKMDGQRQISQLGNGEPVVSGFPTLLHSNTGTRFYDGTDTTALQRDGLDLGFPLAPQMDVPTVSNGAGSLTSGQTYQWRAVCERIDYLGRRWRSAPSPAVSKVLGATDDTAALVARLSVNWLRAGGNANANDLHSSRYVMHFYRTEANGSTFYRTTPPQGAPVAVTAGTFSYSDVIADTSLIVREILYTDGGVLDNNCPPSCRFLAQTEDRVWMGGLWQTELLQSSKILVPGEPPQFSDSPAFQVVLPEPCTGIAAQDGAVVAFARSAVYVVQGAGPNDQGQGAWETPRLITRSTGCKPGAHYAIVVASVGVFFQSDQGIELLPRGFGEPVFVGAPIQDLMYNTSTDEMMPVVSASVVTTLQSRTVRFVVDDSTTTGRVFVYDLDTGAWSRDSYTLEVAGIVDTDRGAVMPLKVAAWSGSYTLLRETLTADQDSVGNSPGDIACSLEWAKLRPFGPAGYGRFMRAIGLFAEKESPSGGYRAGNATITLSIDRFNESGKTFVMSTALDAQDYQLVAPLQVQGTSAKLTLSTTVAGWRFAGWTVELEDIGGGRRMGETEQG